MGIFDKAKDELSGQRDRVDQGVDPDRTPSQDSDQTDEASDPGQDEASDPGQQVDGDNLGEDTPPPPPTA